MTAAFDPEVLVARIDVMLEQLVALRDEVARQAGELDPDAPCPHPEHRREEMLDGSEVCRDCGKHVGDGVPEVRVE